MEKEKNLELYETTEESALISHEHHPGMEDGKFPKPSGAMCLP